MYLVTGPFPGLYLDIKDRKLIVVYRHQPLSDRPQESCYAGTSKPGSSQEKVVKEAIRRIFILTGQAIRAP